MAGPLIGALRVSLSAETASFEAGMKRAQRTTAAATSGISKSLGLVKAGLAAFGVGLTVGLFTNAIKNGLEYAASLGELASTLGVTTKDLQEFSFAAGQVGVSQESLQNALLKLSVTLGQLRAGADPPRKALEALQKGLAAQVLAAPNTGAAFRIIADAMSKVGARTSRAAVEVALFKKAGAGIDNLLSGTEGSLNDLSAAAEKLGIVLSDEQIQKADETADKLRAIKTVLEARIAGVVADNADSILTLADALGDLVAILAKVIGGLAGAGRAMAQFGSTSSAVLETIFPALAAARVAGTLINQAAGGGGSRQISVRLPRPVRDIGTASVGQFLQGPGKKAKEDHSAEEALTRQHQFDQDLLRANIDILNAKKDLATDYVEQTSIAIQIKDAEKDAFLSEQEYQVALNKLTKGKQGETQAQADQLIAAFNIKDDLERQSILADEETKRKEDFNQVTQNRFDQQKDVLQAELAIAETAQEQRDIQLRLLDLSYRQEKARLEAVLADEKASFAAREDARQRLENLNKTRPLDTQAVLQNTRGPLEDYLASLPTTAAKANEALQRLEVEGFNGLIDSILALSEGVDSATKSLLNVLKQFLLGLARIELQKTLGGLLQGGGLLSGLLGGSGSGNFSWLSGAGDTSASLSIVDLPTFASGGSGIFKGVPGIDRNILSMNGIPFARVSHGESFRFGNDNSPARSMGGGFTQVFNFPNSDFDSFKRNQAQAARMARRSLRV